MGLIGPMRIDVVMPAFNVAPWISDAIASVRGQTHADWSLVVVDDGSSDLTAMTVGTVADPRLRLLRQANAGVAVARNRGLAASTGEAVLFLDADDWLASDALARLARALDAMPDAAAAAAPFVFVPETAAPAPAKAGEGRNTGRRCEPEAKQWRSGRAKGGLPPRRLASGHVLPRLLERNLFANGGHLLIRRAALERAGGFRPGLMYGEDWELWCRLALIGPIAVAPGRDPVLFVRQRASGATLRMARDAAWFGPCMDAIFGNPDLLARFGAAAMAHYRRRAETENSWIIGRELVRHGQVREGRRWLRRSALAKPSGKRLALWAAAHGRAAVPAAARGPFRPYGA